MRLPSDPRLPPDIKSPNFLTQLYALFRDISKQLNNLTEGQVSAVTNATSSVPTTGAYQIGDFVRNSAPSELGSAGSKYIIIGWTCTATSPLTFVQTRALTGN